MRGFLPEEPPAVPDLDVLREFVLDDILVETVEPFGEAAWFAWRERRPMGLDIRNGVWWREDGKRVLSLAVRVVDYETYAFRGATEGCAEGICRHATREAADACALTFLVEGRFCTDSLEQS